jgi:hypothetical protein
MGDTEDISSSLLSSIIFSIAVLELVVIFVAKIYCVLQIILFFNNGASWFFFQFLQ